MCGRGWERKPPAPSPSEATLGLGTNTKKVPQLLYFYRRGGRDGTECPLGGRVRRRGGGGEEAPCQIAAGLRICCGGGRQSKTNYHQYILRAYSVYIYYELLVYIYYINLALAFKFKYRKVINHQNSCLLLNNTTSVYEYSP